MLIAFAELRYKPLFNLKGIIYIIPYVSQNNIMGVRRISSITTTGFTFKWYSSGAGYTRVNLNWLAYES